ncbi:hypothetical protein UPYG_G00172600 [Umbra pygmaea]|uniref:Cadherin prodomain domain-containing protein n=1 Tax=Umbra pygmaea TaxID=75934 RepID=A0ABD0WP22_UMBPY
MYFGFFVILTCTLIVGTAWGTRAGQPPKPPCRPGFSESFYTVFVSRDLLRGQSILKEEFNYLFMRSISFERITSVVSFLSKYVRLC